jgi:hypothetical protein
MCEHKLYLRPEKCEFDKTKIKYLSVIISHNKVEMDPVRIAGVADWPTPSNKKEVQSFVGFVNFYQQFILGFSHHVHTDNLNTTQTLEYTKDRYNAKIRNKRVSPKVPPTTYVG